MIYTYGAAKDRRLGIPGEDLPGSIPATEFVAWYNGHPDAVHHEFDLAGPRAVVIGNGNVAVDVARMLMLTQEELAVTDTADEAIEAFGARRSRRSSSWAEGRRQAAFTTPELRELGELTRADVHVDPLEMELDAHSAHWLETGADAAAKRNVALLHEYAAREPRGHRHRISLRFLRSPVAFRPWRRWSGRRSAVGPQPDRTGSSRRSGRGANRGGRGDRVRARAALDRLPRPSR